MEWRPRGAYSRACPTQGYALRDKHEDYLKKKQQKSWRVHAKERHLAEHENNSGIKVARGIRETASQDGAVLLDIEQGLCFSLNGVGAKIWEMVKDRHSLDEITDTLEQEFRLPRTQLLEDVSDFLKRLEEVRLIGKESSGADNHGFFSRLLGRSRSA